MAGVDLATIGAILGSVTAIGGLFYSQFRLARKDAAEKANEIKKELIQKEKDKAVEDEAKEALVKKDMEVRAENLRRDTEQLATNIRQTAEEKATIIKGEIVSSANLNKEHTKMLTDNVLVKIREVDDKVMKMLNDLSTRADMTNGAVKSIRLEIAQTNEDVNSLFDLVEQYASDGDNKEDYASSKTKRRKRLQELRRRKKRSQIDEDSNSEHTKKLNYSI